MNTEEIEPSVINRIVVCEPVCWDAEHAEINAAILLSLRQAWPHASIVFLAECSHWMAVQNVLLNFDCVDNIVLWSELAIADRGLSNSRRIYKDWKIVSEIYRRVNKYKASNVLFLAASSGVLFGIKFQKRHEGKSWIVMHGGLDDLRKKRIRFKKPFYYGNALCLNNQKNVQYLLLGQHIADHLPEFSPKLMPYTSVLEHPAIFSNIALKNNIETSLTIPYFGSIGVVSRWKNSLKFLELAEAIHKLNLKQARFCFIGALMEIDLAKQISTSVAVVKMRQTIGEFLPREELNAAIQRIDYAVFQYPSDAYVLKASGAVIDAFRFAKPIISLRSVMFDDIFNRFGDIGYLCDDEAHLLQVVVDLIQTPNPIRYQAQQKNLILQRDCFGVAASSTRFKALWE